MRGVTVAVQRDRRVTLRVRLAHRRPSQSRTPRQPASNSLSRSIGTAFKALHPASVTNPIVDHHYTPTRRQRSCDHCSERFETARRDVRERQKPANTNSYIAGGRKSNKSALMYPGVFDPGAAGGLPFRRRIHSSDPLTLVKQSYRPTTRPRGQFAATGAYGQQARTRSLNAPAARSPTSPS
jgi:hypothetical protein